MKIEIKRLDEGFIITENGNHKTAINKIDELENEIKLRLSNLTNIKNSLYFKKMDNVKITISVEVS